MHGHTHTHTRTRTRVYVGASEQESAVPGPRGQEEMELLGQARLWPQVAGLQGERPGVVPTRVGGGGRLRCRSR